MIKSFRNYVQEKTEKKKNQKLTTFNKHFRRWFCIRCFTCHSSKICCFGDDAIGNQFGSLNVQSDEFKDSLMDAQMEVTGIGGT